MKTAFRKSFGRDLDALKHDRRMFKRIQEAIENVEAAESIVDLPNLKKLSGADRYYRIRVGDFRIGVAVTEGVVTFVRCLHRREIYRYFP